jgi:hypothetical protein
MVLGFTLLIGLSFFAAFASVSAAVRLRCDGRAELGLAAYVLWNAVVVLPVFWLGWTDHLTRFSAGMLSASTSLGVLTLSFAWVEAKDHLLEVRRAFVSLLRIPVDAIVMTWKRDSFIAFGAFFALLTMVWTAWLSYLAPSSGWDGIWYHESIIGWAIQNHGFRLVEIPVSLENVNGMPRFCETLNLWLVLFTDRRCIEMANSLIAPMLMLATYVIARRYADDRTGPIGWATALYLMPGVILQLRSTYIDVHVAAFFLAALHYVTKREMRLRDAGMAALCIGMLAASKSLGLPWGAILGIVALPRVLLLHVWKRPLPTIAAVLGGLAVAVAIGAPIYVRNWVHFHNLIWPVALNLEPLHIHWPGNTDVVIDKSNKEMLKDILSLPVPGHDFHDPRVWGYGLGFPFFVLPLALVAGPVAFGLMIGAWIRGKPDRVVQNLVFVVLILLATWPVSPQKWFARYNIHMVAGLAFIGSWVGSRRVFRRLSEALAAVTIGSSMMALYWADPGWSVPVGSAIDLAKQSPEERASFEPVGYVYESKAVVAREAEIGPGDVVVFTDVYAFPSLLWNEHFSNQVVYLQSGGGDGFLSRVETANAKWVVAVEGTPEYNALKSHGARWNQVGYMTKNQAWMAFRRVD